MTGNGEERNDQMTQSVDQRLMVSASPSVYKMRFDIKHALNCFDTLRGDPELVESVVKSILRDVLTYLSHFDEANRLLISRCSRVDDDGFEALFESNRSDAGHAEGAELVRAGTLDSVE